MRVEITATGYLHLPVAVAGRFPAGTAIALVRRDELWLLPVSHPGAGGLLLKWRNPRGDRSILVREFLPDGTPPGPREAFWDEGAGALRIPLAASGAGGVTPVGPGAGSPGGARAPSS
ncbi:MAG TPA: hypothetical protein VIK92_09660 [Thermaerobacter sp.]